MFKHLFGKKDQPPRPSRDLDALMRPLAMPAIHLIRSDTPSRSRLGGLPDLPAEVPWPEHEGRQLDFLARLSLSDLHATHAFDWLPATGSLLFFYDIEAQPWGFDPRHRGAARVLHLPDLPASPSSAKDRTREALPALPHHDVAFRKMGVYPSWERDCVQVLDLSDEESDAFIDATEAVFDRRPQHQVGGYPAPVQGDHMELECQLASNGVYVGGPRGYKGETAERLGRDADKWVLLLQFDSDDDLGIMWGDCGRLYYWVEKEAARAGDFSNAWLVLQCS